MATSSGASLPTTASFPFNNSTITSTASTFVPSTAASSATPIPTSTPSGAPLSRWVAIDDADEVTIQYTGDWVTLVNSTDFDGWGNHGKPYQATLHALVNGTGSIAFSINSTRGEVTGTTNVTNTSEVDSDPKWFCTIDGSRFMPDDPSPQAQNNWPLCEWDGLSAGVHVITLNASSNGQPFYFDQLAYVPATGASLAGKSIIVPWSDPKISYDNSWGGYAGSSMMTSKTGALWNFTFEGTSVEWYATLPAQFVQMQTPSNATYVIDGGTPVVFSTGALPSWSATQYNQLQLKTPDVAAGTHTLTVQFLGDTSTAPLFLQSLIVHNTISSDLSTSSTVTTSSTSTETPLPTSSSSPKSSRKTPIGAIVGGAVGAFVVLLIIILTMWYFLYKARKKRRLAEQLPDIDEPLPPVLHPFPLEPKESASPHPPDAAEASESPTYHTAEVKSPYNLTNRRSTPASANVEHRLTLQIQNAALSSSDVTDSGEHTHNDEDVVVHKDSGIRLLDEPTIRTPPVEYPPVYTPR